MQGHVAATKKVPRKKKRTVRRIVLKFLSWQWSIRWCRRIQSWTVHFESTSVSPLLLMLGPILFESIESRFYFSKW